MPELPEVEVVRRGLELLVVGRTLHGVEVYAPRSVRRHPGGADDFTRALAGRTVTGARRRGKYLWLPLDDRDAVVAHLGMSGQLLVRPPEPEAPPPVGPPPVGPPPVGSPSDRHLRVRLVLSDGGQLWFCDQRMFGGLFLSPQGARLPPEIAHIARDPLDPEFAVEAFGAALGRRRTGLKRALLDQRLVSGVGNIYADEALWRARLHYARPTETLRRPEVVRLMIGVREVLVAALEQGGTSFDALYVDVNGRSGYFDRSLDVYGRAGCPCRRCGTPVRRDPFMNRSSYTCPRCQPRPRRARW